MMQHLVIPSGAKGGKGGKGGGGGGGGSEAPDNLRSIQYAKILDLIGEGVIGGMVDGLRSVIYDGVRVMNPDGSYNFSSVSLYWNQGDPNQSVMPGQSSIEAEIAVGVQIKTTTPATRTIAAGSTANRVRVTVAVPSLQQADKKGNVFGTQVDFQILLQSNGGGYQLVTNYRIQGKTSGRYQRAITFPLVGSGPWDVRIVRTTADSTSQLLANDLYWDTYAEITDAKLRYRNSALVGTAIDAAQFSSIPQRIYEVYGLIIQVPNNYDPPTRTYVGTWDGTFKTAYSNNPAWVFYDLVTNTRYGIGTFITAAQVDKFALYAIAKWCDELVPNGQGGSEPRWTCNAVINDRQEAFDLLQSIASIFRGAHFWTGGQLVAIADRPLDPVGIYTNANVVDGVFTYAGSDMKARHTQAAVTWNDPQNLGQPRVSLIDDQDGISRYGLNRLDLIGIGCTSEGQAIRIGKWALYTELNETETVKFSVGLDGAWCRPGDVIQIADILIAGTRRGGRIGAGSTGSLVKLDAPVTFASPGPAYISLVRQDGVVQTVAIAVSALNTPLSSVTPVTTIVPPPQLGATWVISTGDIETQLYRVVAVEQGDNDQTFTISALIHNPSKWGYVERDLALAERDVSNFALPTVTNLVAVEHLVQLSAISLASVVNLSWTSKAALFEVRYRRRSGNWTTQTLAALTIDLPVETGTYEFMVTPVSSVGIRGTTAQTSLTVVGLAGLPTDPENFRIQRVGDVAMLSWAATVDLDVQIGGHWEIRYSPRTSGVEWTTSNIAIRQVAGAATSAEMPYRPGTYLLKPVDSSGFYSSNASVIVSADDTSEHINFIRMCESPTWPGTLNGTAVQLPQQWLMLTNQGGLVDDMTDLIDTWTEIDNLPLGPSGSGDGTGYYYFSTPIDMGSVAPVKLTSELLAFPYLAASVFVDDRTGTVNDWQDWDASDIGASGMALMEVSQTDDDPALSSASWTDWMALQAASYIGRGFRFRLRLEAPENENVAVEEACISADISNKQDSANDVVWVNPAMTIAFTTKFFQPPALAISIQGANVGDTWRITAKTAASFTIELLTSGGAVITAARTFDWQAQGY
jgi:predicted phage tail protein